MIRPPPSSTLFPYTTLFRSGPAPPRRRSRAPWPPPRACYSWSRSWTANVTRGRPRQALTAPSSISAVTPAISAWRRPSMVDAARFTARPTASSIELVEVPVSVIVFSTIEVSSRRRRAPPFHYRRGLRRRCKLRRADGAVAARGLSLAPARKPRQQRRVGRECERRRGGGLEPVHGHGVVPGDEASGGIGQPGGEPDADGRLLRLVEVRRDLDHLADHDLHPSLLACLARRGDAHVLAPLDEAAREAPPAGAELPGRAPDQEYAPRSVADDTRRAHARVGEEDEAAARAARPRDAAPHDAHERGPAPRARDPVLTRQGHRPGQDGGPRWPGARTPPVYSRAPAR